jgi:hypothetical protein
LRTERSGKASRICRHQPDDEINIAGRAKFAVDSRCNPAADEVGDAEIGADGRGAQGDGKKIGRRVTHDGILCQSCSQVTIMGAPDPLQRQGDAEVVRCRAWMAPAQPRKRKHIGSPIHRRGQGETCGRSQSSDDGERALFN